MTGLSVSGALNLVIMVALLLRISIELIKLIKSRLGLLTRNVQATDLILVGQVESEALCIVVDNFDI